MLRFYTICVLCLVSLSLPSVGARTSTSVLEGSFESSGQASTQRHPPVTGMNLFLYYNDIDKAVEFYRDTLGLRATLEKGPIRMFEITPTFAIGLVDAKTARGGASRPSKDKPLSVAFVVDDIDGWYRYLVARGVAIARPPRDSSNLNVRVFLFTDPEGYELEVISYTGYGK